MSDGRVLFPDVTLEIFGQQGSAGFHTPFLFCYALHQKANIDALETTLRDGLTRLCGSLPWVAGNVVNEGKTATHSGTFKIRTIRSCPDIVVRDHREDERVASWSDLVARDFPISDLDEGFFSPVPVLPDGTPTDRSAVLTVQLNVLRGGLILTIDGHHQALDGTGQEQICHLLDKACSGEAFTDEEVEMGNKDRATIVDNLPDSWQPTQDSRYLVPEEPAKTEQSERSPLVWANIAFSGESLRPLKAEASKSVPRGFVSTNDCLTALIWQSFARVRRRRLPPTTSTMGRAINPRRYLGIPDTYPGYITNMAYSNMSMDELADRPIGEIASVLRAAVDPDTSGLGQSTRELATLLHRADDRDTVSVTNMDLDKDIMLSSWSNMRCYQFDFGLGLGRPVAFRRAKHAFVPSLMFLLPQHSGGEIVAAICSRVDDLDGVRADEMFSRFARYIG